MSEPSTAHGRAGRRHGSRIVVSAAALAAAALVAVALVLLTGGTGRGSAGAALPFIGASEAPAGWHAAALPDGAVLSYPPSLHLVAGDAGTATAARFGPDGDYLLYLNATPRQGGESLANWPGYRLAHLRADDARAARELAAFHGVRFLGGTGTCVLDTYITKVAAHHFTELACFVQGRHAASVVVAAAPAGSWAQSAGLLERAVAGYRVR